jgi:hypothetical protein
MNSAEVMAAYAMQLARSTAVECPALGSPDDIAMQLNSGRAPGTWAPKAGRDGLSVVDMDTARAKIEAKRSRRQARSLQSTSDL